MTKNAATAAPPPSACPPVNQSTGSLPQRVSGYEWLNSTRSAAKSRMASKLLGPPTKAPPIVGVIRCS